MTVRTITVSDDERLPCAACRFKDDTGRCRNPVSVAEGMLVAIDYGCRFGQVATQGELFARERRAR